MDLSRFLTVLRARWMPVLLVFAAVLSAAIAYVVFAPRSFTATAELLIAGRPDPLESVLYGGTASPTRVNTQIDVLRSDRVARRVIQDLKLADLADLRRAWAAGGGADGSLQDWLARFLQAGLDVDVMHPGSDVVRVGFRSGDPRFAAAVANGFVRAYLETSIELRIDPARDYTSFFDDQLKAARDNLQAAQDRSSSFQRTKGIVVTDDRLDTEMSRLNLLTEELVQIQAQRVDAATRQSEAHGGADDMSEVLGNTTINALKADLADAEEKLQGLDARYGDRYPAVQDARARIAALQARIARETARVRGSIDIDARMSRQREADVQAAIEAQRAKVLRMKQLRDQGALLASDVDHAQHAYDELAARASQSRLASQNRQSDASVVSLASVPSLPSSPRVGVDLLLGLCAALGLAMASAWLIEHFDHRVRSASDVVRGVGLPVIGILPSPAMTRRAQGQLALARRRVIFGRRPSTLDREPA